MILDARENGGGWKGKPRASGDDPIVVVHLVQCRE